MLLERLSTPKASSTRPRQRCTSYSDTDEDKTLDPTIQQNFGMAQPGPADAPLDTDSILFFVMVTKLDIVEFSTLGSLSTVARVTTRRLARPKVLGEMVREDNRRPVRQEVGLRSPSPAVGSHQKTRAPRPADGAQGTPEARNSAVTSCSPVPGTPIVPFPSPTTFQATNTVKHFTVQTHAHIFSLRTTARTIHPMHTHCLKIFKAILCVSKNHSTGAPCHTWVFSSSLLHPLSCLRLQLRRHC